MFALQRVPRSFHPLSIGAILFLKMLTPLRGMVEGVTLPTNGETVFELPDAAGAELVRLGACVEVKGVASAEADVEVRVVEAAEKRGPGRPPKAE